MHNLAFRGLRLPRLGAMRGGGGGGGGGGYNYAADGTLLFWMDAGRFDGTNPTSGSTLTENWGNRMGGAYPRFRQPTAGNQPTLAQVNDIWVADFGAAINNASTFAGMRYMRFVNSAGTNITVDAVDTHTMALIYIGDTVGSRYLLGLDDDDVNRQIGLNNGTARVVGSPVLWNNQLQDGPTITRNNWYLFEAILRGDGNASSIWLNGVQRDTTTFDQTSSVLIDLVGAGKATALSERRNLGGKIARMLTYDITAGLAPGAADARADMRALQLALEA